MSTSGPAPSPTEPAARRGGPRTVEGKARSALNALRHGLRAARFALLPHEDARAFRELVEGLRLAHAPDDPVELLYVDAIAVAIWRELRVDRLEAEILADIVPAEPGHGCGSDLAEPAARASLATIARYRAAAQAEHRRALKLLEEHRRLRLEALERAALGGRPDALADLPTVETTAPEPERVSLRTRAREERAARERIRLRAADFAGLGAGAPADPFDGLPIAPFARTAPADPADHAPAGAAPFEAPPAATRRPDPRPSDPEPSDREPSDPALPGPGRADPAARDPGPYVPCPETRAAAGLDPIAHARLLIDRWLEEHPDGVAPGRLRVA